MTIAELKEELRAAASSSTRATGSTCSGEADARLSDEALRDAAVVGAARKIDLVAVTAAGGRVPHLAPSTRRYVVSTSRVSTGEKEEA